MQEVGVDAEGGLAALVLCDLDLVLLGELQQGLPGLEVPLPPGGDDMDVGLQGVVAELEPDLVIALAGGTMADGVRAGLAGDVDLLLGDQGPGDGGAQQVLALIDRVGPEHGEDVVADEFLAHVLDEDVLGLDPGGQGLGPGRLDLLALAEVGGEGHHLAAVFGLQPLQDDRGIKTARIGKDDFLGLQHAGLQRGFAGD